MKLKSRTARLVAGTILASGGLVGATSILPATVEAAPSSCYGGFANNRNAYFVCNTGGGEHRAIAYCKNTALPGGTTKFGPWRTNGQQSWVACPWGTVITQLYYGVR